MFRDLEVFREGWIPQRLPGREAESTRVVHALGRADGPEGQAEDLLISGPSGVGKTTLARYALRVVQEQIGLRLDRTLVPCLGLGYGSILREVLWGLGVDDVHEGTPTADLDVHLRERVDGPTVIVLDEGGDLPGTDVLETLVDVPQLSVIAICHDPDDWLARVDSSVRERFRGRNHVPLDRYSVEELRAILEPRYRLGIRDGAPPYRRLEELADRAAGVARLAIQGLRAAWEHALEAGRDEIAAADVAPGIEVARQRIRQDNLDSLPIHHHVLYELLRSADSEWVSGAEVHRRYDAVAGRVYADVPARPISRRARRAKMPKLVDYDLIEADGDGSGRRYRVLDAKVCSDVVDVERKQRSA